MTPACAVQNIQRLSRNVLPDCIPSPEELPDYAADWCAALPDVTDAQLSAAVVAWLRDPARGRYWPGIADLAERIPGMARPAITDPDERAWEMILADVALGAYQADPGERVAWEEVIDSAGVRRMQPRAKQSALEASLTPAQRSALATIGGAYAVRRAGADEQHPEIARAALRRRFLSLARTAATAPLPAISERTRAGAFPLPASVLAFVGTEETGARAARRELALVRERDGQ